MAPFGAGAGLMGRQGATAAERGPGRLEVVQDRMGTAWPSSAPAAWALPLRCVERAAQYTSGFHSQESAVYSAMKVAEPLAPDSHTLPSLKTLLAARGLAGTSYDL